jgi:hypothetical protein
MAQFGHCYNCYTFLGTIIARNGSMSKERNRTISSGRLAMINLEKIMKDRDVTVTTKSKIVETMIFPIVTYGSKSWMVRKKEKKKMLLSYGHVEGCYERHGQIEERTPQ